MPLDVIIARNQDIYQDFVKDEKMMKIDYQGDQYDGKYW